MSHDLSVDAAPPGMQDDRKDAETVRKPLLVHSFISTDHSNEEARLAKVKRRPI